MKSLVSVIVPTYNSEKTLERCLNAIKNQTYNSIEIIVVDQESSDQTIKIAKKFKTKIIVLPKPKFYSPPTKSRNAGAAISKGKYLLHLDSDMVLTENVVSECVAKGETGYGAVVIHEVDYAIGFWAKCKALERGAYVGDRSIEGARFFNAKQFKVIRGYDETLSSGEDWDIHERFKRVTKIAEVDAKIIHLQGKIYFLKQLRKKYNYGKTILNYVNKNKKTSFAKISPIRVAYLRVMTKIFNTPLLILGFIFLKTAETLAASLGVLSTIFKKKKQQNGSIFLFDHYSLNKGDMAILLGTLKMLLSAYPNSKIFVEASHPKITEGSVNTYFNTNKIKILPRILMTESHDWENRRKSKVANLYFLYLIPATLFWTVIYKLFKVDLAIINFQKRQTLRSLYSSDIVISVGGGFINKDFYYQLRLINLIVAKIFWKKFILLGQSIGPFKNSFERRIVLFFLKYCDLIVLRERISYNLFTNSPLFRNKVIISSDFALNTYDLKATTFEQLKPRSIGITVNTDFVKNKNKFFNEFSSFLDKVIEEYDVNLCFVVMDSPDPGNIDNIRKRMQNQAKTQVIGLHLDAIQTKSVFSKFILTLNFRFHGVVFSYLSQVPPIGIAVTHKTKGFMDEFGMSQQCFNAKEFIQDQDKVIKIIGELIRHRGVYTSNIRSSMTDKIKSMDTLPQIIDQISPYLLNTSLQSCSYHSSEAI